MPSEPQDSPPRSSPPPIDLSDLSGMKFGPAWVTEAAPDLTKFEGRGGDDRRGDRFGSRDRGQRPPPRRDQGGGFGGPRPPRQDARGGGAPRRDGPPGGGFRREGERGAPPPRPQGGGGPRPPGVGPRPQGGGPRPGGAPGPRDQREPRGPREFRREGPPPERRAERPPPLPVKIEFLPDPEVLLALAHQIRASHLAYPLFGLARKFLEKLEYHRVRISPVAPANGGAAPELFRVGADGLVTLDRRFAERIAFERFSKDFYEETVEQGEPPKGNFSNVARCRLDGTLLGPTNHHSYQAALRGLWESRYARRMPFEAFRQYEIEVVNDPAEVERWKEQSRTMKTWVVKGSEPPLALRSPEEVRRHFEQQHLPQLVLAVPDAEFAAAADRDHGPDAPLARTVRFEGEHEARHPLNLVQHVRTGLQRAGLQVFKHKKKVVYVSAVRPVPFRADAGSPVSPNIQAILDAVTNKPGLSRAELALAVIGAAPPVATPADVEVPLATESESVPPEAKAAETDSLATDDTVAGEMVPPSPEPAGEAEEAHPVAEEIAHPVETAEAPLSPDATATVTEEASTPPVEAPATEAVPPPAPLSPAEEAYAKAKAALVADLRWLLLSGHVMGFFDGTFDLPPTARPPMPATPAAGAAPTPSEESHEAAAAADASGHAEPAESPEAPAEEVAPTEPPAPVEDPTSAENVPVEGTEAKDEPPPSERPAAPAAEPPRHA